MVRYDCPNCSSRLSSPLDDAGTTDKCPDCHSGFTVPGAVELERRRNQEALVAKDRKEQEENKQRHRELLAQRAREKQRHAEIVAEQQRQLDDIREIETHQLQHNEISNCPFCAEEILAAAKKCKHCGEFLDPQLRQQQSRTVNVINNKPSNGVAAVLSLVIPGAGQMYKGHVGEGLLWLIFVGIGYVMFVIPGLVLHLICIIAAASDG